MIRTNRVSIEGQTQIHITLLADGVTACAESCPYCSRQTLVIRGPGHHRESFTCEACGSMVMTSADISEAGEKR